MLVMLHFASKLEIDTSAETLLLKGDKDLAFTREITKRFSTSDFIVMTYTIDDDLLSTQNLKNLKNLQNEIMKHNDVQSVNSILNVPLLQSPPVPIKDIISGVKTLESSEIDKKLAQQEFLTSPIYKNNLVSKDFKTTALLINLKRDTKYFELINKRDSFITLKKTQNLTQEQLILFEKVEKELKLYRDTLRVQNHQLILDMRKIQEEFRDKTNATIHLGGANMIADDMVEFVKSDLSTFGYMIFGLLVIILFLLFREIRWVVIPLFICSVSIIITSGFLGLFSWEITVISSNFISLQLIMNMSLVIHLIIKYKELLVIHPNHSQKELTIQTVIEMWKPSFFVVVTTIAGFSSLVFSGILPIITFGWMMSIGIVISLLTTFLLFPIVVSFLNKSYIIEKKENKKSFTSSIASYVFLYKKTILFSTIVIIIFSITGAMQLRVENSFIDYFKKDTQIYQGMKLIDQKLGGTTPLDIVITFKGNSDEVSNIQFEDAIDNNEEDELDSFEDEFETSNEDKEQYWFTQSKLDKVILVHNYLDSLEAVGKVQSLATFLEVGKILNDGVELDALTLALINKEIPNKYKKMILTPYVDIENNMLRISARIIDSLPHLKRNELIKKIDYDLQKILNPEYEEYKISNLLVIYNNMLQSLFDSQIKTIGLVIFILFVMFLVLFKSIKIATVAIIANTVPVGVIFGFMGWMDIPLDMMTITIAAISIGIAVDDTIHYIHRFLHEYKDTNDLNISIKNAHNSIGQAMFYTSTIIMIGFSILAFSSFIPTIYFGILTVIAMLMAIVSDLLLLPILLLLIKLK